MTTVSHDAPPVAASSGTAKWRVSEVEALYQLPLMDLLFRAQQVHRENFDPNEVQRSALISIKTGGCSEDCSYCSQSARYKTETEREALMQVESVLEAAKEAKAKGASRFCMGAAWRGPKEKELEVVTQMIREVKALGLETCVTLGMLKDGQASKLKEAGLDYYNHNLDTDAEFYDQVISTHKHEDRIDTIAQVRQAGIKVCWLNAKRKPRWRSAENPGMRAAISSALASSARGGISKTTLSGWISSKWPAAKLSCVQLMNTFFLPTRASAPA